MNQKWKAFLSENVAEFQELSLQEEMLFDLSDHGLIKVDGEDAESFLQNQLSNDIRNVTETTHQVSAWCSPKGRIIATFQIFQHNQAYYLSTSSDLVEHLIKKLRMYVMMSKVTVEDVSDSFVHFAYSGNNLDNAPTELNQTVSLGGLSILKVAGDIPRFEIFGDTLGDINNAKSLWEKCATTATTVKDNGWDYLNIKAGIPIISQASSESWIPQMVNFIAIGGIDFKKGCYPGQEVVARLNYLGKTKRRMYRLLIDSNALPNVGDALSSNNDKEAGKILNATINPDGKVEALAVLKIAEADSTLQLSAENNNDKATITLLDLPYSVDG